MEGLDSLRRKIFWDAEAHCEKRCLEGLRPCSVLQGIQRRTAEKGSESDTRGKEELHALNEVYTQGVLKIAKNLEYSRSHAFMKLQDRCKEQCREELRPCSILQMVKASGKEKGWFSWFTG